MADNIFVQCSDCKKIWESREKFLLDPTIELSGYQPNFNQLEAGSFLFKHSLCEEEISLEVAEFSDLYHGPVFQKPLTGTGSCPSYCLYKDNLKGCKEICECAYVRSVMQIIRHYKVVSA